jgi:hypothetical protein
MSMDQIGAGHQQRAGHQRGPEAGPATLKNTAQVNTIQYRATMCT